MDTVGQALIVVAIVAQPVLLLYLLPYETHTLALVIPSGRQVRRREADHFVEDVDLIDHGDLTKPLTMIVFGRSVGTVCEDMEIIVRLYRFVRGKLQDRRWDAWRGKTGWEKFARVGFRERVAPAHG